MFTAIVAAQLLKVILYTLIRRKWDFRMLTTTGGMPSSHSAGVVSLSMIVGFINGFDSTLFAVAFGNACIVMYDAAGIRRASGKMAVCLNKIMDDFYKHDVQAVGEKLKELLGHTPIEVFAGALFGIIYSYYMHFMVFQ
ncbi:divergent PAP2 family protein [bacterium]|nr:divergent PAP2 family protein [bacterium]